MKGRADVYRPFSGASLKKHFTLNVLNIFKVALQYPCCSKLLSEVYKLSA